MPVTAMNDAGRAEKAVPRPGLPATMHIWWSRKPTGLARAVLFASIIDDPLDRLDLWPTHVQRHSEHLRLSDLVADLARWDCPAERIDEAQQLISDQCGGNPPTVIDPFCGGGAIPLEAVRLGLDADAIDLNPVAALITKGLVEVPSAVSGRRPVHPDAVASGTCSGMAGVAADVAAYGNQLLDEVHARIGHFYPPVGDGCAVSYLWARTGSCTNTACGGELPLLSTWWLRKARGPQWHVAPVPDCPRERTEPGHIAFEVRQGAPPEELKDLKVGTGATYRCPLCGEVTKSTALREQSMRGELGLRLIAIQTFADPGSPRAGRSWVSADDYQAEVALRALPSPPTGDAARELPVVDIPLPIVSGNMGGFGIDTIEKLLTPRQQLLMVTMCEALRDLRPTVENDARRAGLTGDSTHLRDGGNGARAYAEAITTYLALAISRMANRVSTMTVHNRANGSVEQSFIQLGFAFYGDFPEANPFSGSTGSFANSLEHVVAAVAALPTGRSARVRCGPATELVPANEPGIVCTDPPYYDMLDYSALSNLFYAWLRLALRDVWPDETATAVAPDQAQIVSNHRRFDGDKVRSHDHFEAGLRDAVAALRSAQLDDFPLTLYYGYQQTQRRSNGRSSNAWEVLLGALIAAGFQIVSTWPLRTERPEGVKTGSKSLASSILLACRVRPPTAATTTREQFVAELWASLRGAVRTLLDDNLAPVDLAQSAIGPGMVVYSSYSQVLEADGGPVTVRTALELIHLALDEIIAESDAGFDPETRWAIGWFGARGWEVGKRSEAEQRAAACNTSISRLIEAGIVGAEPGTVRLRCVDELATRRPPRPSVWDATHRLSQHLALGRQTDAARVLVTLDLDTTDAVKALAYRLFLVCNERRWTAEAVTMNSIVRAWGKLVESQKSLTENPQLERSGP